MDWGSCLVTTITKDGRLISEKTITLSCIGAVFQNVATALFMFVGTVALIFLIISGYKYMSSGGDPKQIEGAKQTFVYSIIGLLVVLFSVFILTIVSKITGVDFAKIKIF